MSECVGGLSQYLSTDWLGRASLHCMCWSVHGRHSSPQCQCGSVHGPQSRLSANVALSIDHTRALAPQCQCGCVHGPQSSLSTNVALLPRYWNRRSGRPHQTWLQTGESNVAPLKIVSATNCLSLITKSTFIEGACGGTSHTAMMMMMMINSLTQSVSQPLCGGCSTASAWQLSANCTETWYTLTYLLTVPVPLRHDILLGLVVCSVCVCVCVCNMSVCVCVYLAAGSLLSRDCSVNVLLDVSLLLSLFHWQFYSWFNGFSLMLLFIHMLYTMSWHCWVLPPAMLWGRPVDTTYLIASCSSHVYSHFYSQPINSYLLVKV